jgi:hypothetical protein
VLPARAGTSLNAVPSDKTSQLKAAHLSQNVKINNVTFQDNVVTTAKYSNKRWFHLVTATVAASLRLQK